MDFEIYEDEIELYIDEFLTKNNIPDMKKETQLVFQGLCRYIGKKVFKGTNKLKINDAIYNPLLVKECLEKYLFYCSMFDKYPTILDFQLFAGLGEHFVDQWKESNVNSLNDAIIVYNANSWEYVQDFNKFIEQANQSNRAVKKRRALYKNVNHKNGRHDDTSDLFGTNDGNVKPNNNIDNNINGNNNTNNNMTIDNNISNNIDINNSNINISNINRTIDFDNCILLSPVRREIYKILMEYQEHGLESKLTSVRNAVGTIAILNHRFGWSSPYNQQKTTNVVQISANELPKIAVDNAQNNPEIEQKD